MPWPPTVAPRAVVFVEASVEATERVTEKGEVEDSGTRRPARKVGPKSKAGAVVWVWIKSQS